MRIALLFSGQGLQGPQHLAQLRDTLGGELRAALAAVLPELALDPQPSGQAQAAPLTGMVPAPVTETLELARNRIAQPLIYALQMQIWQALSTRLPVPVCAAGYSLGEMAACAAAGMFSPAAGVALCAARAAAMDGCVGAPAGLLAVLGLDAGAVAAIAAASGLFVAIRNGPDHFVLGGTGDGIAAARDLAETRGATRVVTLAVTTPSHTPLLAAAGSAMAPRLAPFHQVRLAFPVISAIDGRSLRNGDAAAAALARQICTPLDWRACLDAVAEMQPEAVLEIGPGSALARMWAERGDGIPVRACDEFRSTDGVLDWLRRTAAA